MNLLNDIYYSKDYIPLYLKEDEAIFEFEYKEDDFIFYNIAIKRPILKIGNDVLNNIYYDLETVYGYGGFYSNTSDQNFLIRATNRYKARCIKEKIIAEFVRFHPFNEFPILNTELFKINIYDRDIVYVDLSLEKENRWKTYSSNTRNILRKCEKELVFEKSSNLETFISLYKTTMDRNGAGDFYYFTEEYYSKLLENINVELFEIKTKEDATLVSSAFFMFSENFAHYHLSANNYDMRQYNANYFLLDQAFEVAKGKEAKYCILGGGTTCEKDDSLLRFKQKFSKVTKPFYISGNVYNETIYNEYIKKWEIQSRKSVKYFLKYRLGI